MQGREFDYRRGADWGDAGDDREGSQDRRGGYERDAGYGYRRGGYDAGRDWEREEFMLRRRGYGAGAYEGRDVRRWESDRGGGGGRREEYGEFEPGEGEIMYRPGLMRTSNHSDTDYERGNRGPIGSSGYWGQGGARGADLSGYSGETVWEGGYGRGASGREWDADRERYGGRTQSTPGPSSGSRFYRGSIRGRDGGDDVSGYGQGDDLYREGGMTREGRQIAARQAGSYTGRGPRGYRRSDDRIREDVCEALTYHDGIDACDVEVRVEGGQVTLAGTVGDRRQKRVAEDAIEGIAGVADVHNELRVEQRTGQPGRWDENDLARTGQTTTGATTRAATAGTRGTEGATGADPRIGREGERAGTNDRSATRTR